MFPILPNRPFARSFETKSPLHIADLTTDEAYLAGNPDTLTLSQRGARTYLLMPLLRGGDELIGTMALLRSRVLPFTDRQIDLARAFAAEAIVAFESTRRERRYPERCKWSWRTQINSRPWGESLRLSLMRSINR